MTTGTILFNPFTGQPRHPSDIASDPKGLLIWDGEEPLRAVQPSQTGDAQDAARYRWLREYLPSDDLQYDDNLVLAKTGEDIDAAIDAAINAKGSK